MVSVFDIDIRIIQARGIALTKFLHHVVRDDTVGDDPPKIRMNPFIGFAKLLDGLINKIYDSNVFRKLQFVFLKIYDEMLFQWRCYPINHSGVSPLYDGVGITFQGDFT